MMDEIERVMKDLLRILEKFLEEAESVDEIEERVEAIKRDLSSWFLGGYPLYQAS
ncbi:MAG: hypothetical protein QMD80_06100 [archaeon]|nr:hypothetical protein [archaeon]